MKILLYILIFLFLLCVAAIFMLMNKIEDLEEKIEEKVEENSNQPADSYIDSVNEIITVTIDGVNENITQLNQSINELKSRTGELEGGENIYRITGGSELGYEVDHNGSIVFNKPVIIKNDLKILRKLSVFEDLDSLDTNDSGKKICIQAFNSFGNGTDKGAYSIDSSKDLRIEKSGTRKAQFGENINLLSKVSVEQELITPIIKNKFTNLEIPPTNVASISFDNNGIIKFKTADTNNTHIFGNTVSTINNMAVAGSSNYFKIYNKNTQSDTNYSFMASPDGDTFINCKEDGCVEFRRANNVYKSRIKCAIFRPAVKIPRGNDTTSGINYHGTGYTDGRVPLKISRFMCQIGAEDNDVVLAEIERADNPNSTEVEWMHLYDYTGGNKKMIRTFGFNTNSIEYKLYGKTSGVEELVRPNSTVNNACQFVN